MMERDRREKIVRKNIRYCIKKDRHGYTDRKRKLGKKEFFKNKNIS